MRKLKLQMQTSVDGFVAGPAGQLDWMAPLDKDPKILAFINELTDSCDTILLGRKMTDGFTGYWESVPQDSPEYDFARKMVDTPKVMFSRTSRTPKGKNVRVENGDLATAVNALKKQPGKDLMVYGGAGFVSSLVQNDLIDELNLFVNPAALGDGLKIFTGRKNVKLARSVAYDSGVVVNTYQLR